MTHDSQVQTLPSHVSPQVLEQQLLSDDGVGMDGDAGSPLPGAPPPGGPMTARDMFLASMVSNGEGERAGRVVVVEMRWRVRRGSRGVSHAPSPSSVSSLSPLPSLISFISLIPAVPAGTRLIDLPPTMAALLRPGPGSGPGGPRNAAQGPMRPGATAWGPCLTRTGRGSAFVLETNSQVAGAMVEVPGLEEEKPEGGGGIGEAKAVTGSGQGQGQGQAFVGVEGRSWPRWVPLSHAGALCRHVEVRQRELSGVADAVARTIKPMTTGEVAGVGDERGIWHAQVWESVVFHGLRTRVLRGRHECLPWPSPRSGRRGDQYGG